jgi:hypothetical protein
MKVLMTLLKETKNLAACVVEQLLELVAEVLLFLVEVEVASDRISSMQDLNHVYAEGAIIMVSASSSSLQSHKLKI